MSYFVELDLKQYNFQADLDWMFEDGKIWWTMDQICINAPARTVLHSDRAKLRAPDPEHHMDFAFGVGSLTVDWRQVSTTPVKDKGGYEMVDKLSAPPRVPPLKEEEFDTLCSVFRGTDFELAYNELNERYNLGRVRLMMMQPRRCLSWHYDYENRIHYPIKTQKGNFMVIEEEVKHLEQDQWYLTKTGYNNHTAFNGSSESRTHLVANLLGEK